MTDFDTARVASEKAVFRPALPPSFLPGLNGTEVKELTKIPENVWATLHKIGDAVGRMEAERFTSEMHSRIVEREMSSPIEQLFFVALHAMCRARYIEINPDPEFNHLGKFALPSGLNVVPQAKIDRYKADFLISFHDPLDGTSTKKVVVELDGHDFHDRDKHQRSYEKARDRHFQRAGYTVLHFTGSDVVADPLAVAHEVLAMTGGSFLVDAIAYNPADPLGLD